MIRFPKRKIIQLILFCVLMLIVFQIILYGSGKKRRYDIRVFNSIFDHLNDVIVNVNVNESIYDSSVSIISSIYNEQLKNKYDETKYQIKLNKKRLDELFKILQQKEVEYKEIFRHLDVLLFNDVINRDEQRFSDVYYRFRREISHYFDTEFDNVVVKENFVDDLKYLSHYFSYLKPRIKIEPSKIVNDALPVIVTAANAEYYSPMQATVQLIHQNYPDCKLIIYDLGLTPELVKKTKENCRCEVRKFDENKKYSKQFPHVTNLKTYAWKPLIIQEVLREHDRVIYIDSSIRLYEATIMPHIYTVQTTGLLSQFIGLKLLCYTNPLMFDWFHENKNLFQNLDTIEANIFFMNKNFLNTLIMKAWISCALDEKCIAPEGSTTGGCCGCHRYDQDAITIINTFFYGHPTEPTYLPAYSFTKEESYFFKVERYQGINYFS